MVGAISAISLSQIPPFSRQPPHIFSNPRPLPSPPRGIPIRNPRPPTRFVVSADTNGGGGGGGNELKEERRPAFNLRWRDLLDPDPENILAVGLTCLLTWASVQVLYQLFFISIAILLAALKYSLIAAFLLFILITLL